MRGCLAGLQIKGRAGSVGLCLLPAYWSDEILLVLRLQSKVVSSFVMALPGLKVMESRPTRFRVVAFAEVGDTVTADHLIQMATLPTERKPTVLGIPGHVPTLSARWPCCRVCTPCLQCWPRVIRLRIVRSYFC